jgi:hypothetical protein
VLPVSVKMLTTPRGSSSTSAMTSATSALVNAVWPGSLTATVLPAARAGPSARTNSATGAFHGMMSPATPMGSLSVLK